MKRHNKDYSFVVYILTIIITFVLSFLLLYLVNDCLHRFDLKHGIIGTENALWIVFSISMLLSIVNTILIANNIRTLKSSKLGFWLDNNYPKVIIGYVIILLLLESITEKTIWTANEISEVISLEWTIFGLSLTIFLVWNVLIVKYLENKQPSSSDEGDNFQKYTLLLKKQSFSQEVDTIFSTTVLLSINLILLLFSSMLVYIIHKPEMLVTQNVVCCTFYFSINTIATLFFDILKPLKADKDKLKKQNQVTKRDLDTAKAGMFIHTLFAEGVKRIKESPKWSDEEKKELAELYVETVKNALLEIAENNGDSISSLVIPKAPFDPDWIEDYS